jgi:hypothetical protein
MHVRISMLLAVTTCTPTDRICVTSAPYAGGRWDCPASISGTLGAGATTSSGAAEDPGGTPAPGDSDVSGEGGASLHGEASTSTGSTQAGPAIVDDVKGMSSTTGMASTSSTTTEEAGTSQAASGPMTTSSAELEGSSGSSGADACGNGALDRGETDVDCGGPVCPACEDFHDCLEDADCAGELCQDLVCTPMECVPSGDIHLACQDCMKSQCCLNVVECMSDDGLFAGCPCWFECVKAPNSFDWCRQVCGIPDIPEPLASCALASCDMDCDDW